MLFTGCDGFLCELKPIIEALSRNLPARISAGSSFLAWVAREERDLDMILFIVKFESALIADPNFFQDFSVVVTSMVRPQSRAFHLRGPSLESHIIELTLKSLGLSFGKCG
jgi:hypothetical protein